MLTAQESKFHKSYLNEMVNKVVVFFYKGEPEEREVEVETIKDCKNGKLVIIGRDRGREMKYRSFDVNDVTNIWVIADIPAMRLKNK